MLKWLKSWTVDRLIIVSTTLTVIAEVVINFITSYQHIYDLGLKFGEFGVDARLMPVGIDLMLLAFAEVNLFLSRRGRKNTWMRAGLGLGVTGTVMANAAYGANWGTTGALLAFWSPLALFATVEAGMLLLRVAAEDREKQASAAVSGPPGGMPVDPAWDDFLAWKQDAAITYAAPVFNGTEPREEADASEPEGKVPSPAALNLARWQELNGAGK
jgi:hypothetical protein